MVDFCHFCQEANAANHPWDQLMGLPAPRDAKRPSFTSLYIALAMLLIDLIVTLGDALGQNWHIEIIETWLEQTETCRRFASNTFSSKMKTIS